MMDLEEFASANDGRKTVRCPVCNLPDDIKAQVVAGKLKGIGSVMTTRWLRSKDFEVSQYAVQNHFTRGHD